MLNEIIKKSHAYRNSSFHSNIRCLLPGGLITAQFHKTKRLYMEYPFKINIKRRLKTKRSFFKRFKEKRGLKVVPN